MWSYLKHVLEKSIFISISCNNGLQCIDSHANHVTALQMNCLQQYSQ